MKHIVIVGAGFGGLRAAILIGRDLKRLKLTDRYHLTVVERNRYHTYTPLLYEAATTSPETASLHHLHEVVVYDLPELLAGLPVHWIQDEVKKLDVQNGDVHLMSGNALKADYLVLAMGAEVNFFNIPGLQENALPFKSFADALAIRNVLLNRAKGGHEHINLVVGGAGPTGVEFAGEVKAWCGELRAEFQSCSITVTLIEAAPTILPGFAQKVIDLASVRLREVGVAVRTASMIKQVGRTSLSLQDGTVMNYDVLVWSGGVKAPALLQGLPLKTEARGRIEVQSAMDCLPQTSDLQLLPMVYALGDIVCVYNPETKKPIPGVARAALMQANVVAHNVIADIKKEIGRTSASERIVYRPANYPYVLPIGGKYAIAKIGPVVLSGFFGWMFKGLVEINYLLSIMPFWRAIKVWLQGLKIFVQNDRLG